MASQNCVKEVIKRNESTKIYLAKIEYNGLTKARPSTMWPNNYGPVEIARDTAQALNNLEHVIKKKQLIVQGRAKSGILVEIQFDTPGDIYTSYPAIKDKNGVLQI